MEGGSDPGAPGGHAVLLRGDEEFGTVGSGSMELPEHLSALPGH